ncbi:MAG: O-antigen ligase family protein [Nitrospirae bacterium]|nr:O-antigen ligase family protein [Nitrospirota bacterium]
MAFLKEISTEALLRAGYAGMFFSLPLATSPTVVCGTFVLIVWVLSGKFLASAQEFYKSDLMLPVAILVTLPWIGLLYCPSPADGLSIALKTHYWLYAIALATLPGDEKYPDLTFRMFLAGLSVNSIISVLQFAGIVSLKKGLATGLLGGSSPHITYSLLLTTGILLASFGVLKSESKRERLLYSALMLQYLFTIGYVGGRSGYIALIILSPFVVYNIMGQKHIVKIIAVSIIAVSLLFVSPVIRSRFMKAGEDIVYYQAGAINTSVGLRFHMWEIAISEIKKSPLTGIGTGGFRKSWENFKGDPLLPFHDHPHNSFLHMMVSYGIVGLAAFCYLLFLLLKKGWHGRHSTLGFSVFAFTAVFIIGSLTDTQVLTFATAIAFSLFAGQSEAIDVS